MSTPLKLRAVDADDLAVLGACLQDALVAVQDMRFLGAENRFVMVANRFCWEKLGPGARLAPEEGARAESAEEGARAESAEEESGAGPYERVHCGITFEHVTSVKARGFTPGAAADQGRLFEVLTILAEDGLLTLVFSGGAAVRLEVGAVEAFVQDMGEPWPTLWRPHHPVDDELDRDGETG
jgi:hypothetical protein